LWRKWEAARREARWSVSSHARVITACDEGLPATVPVALAHPEYVSVAAARNGPLGRIPLGLRRVQGFDARKHCAAFLTVTSPPP
jgi:hypothetical protein